MSIFVRPICANIGQPDKVTDNQRRQAIKTVASIAKDFVAWSEINDSVETDQIKESLPSWWHSHISFWGRQTSVSPKWKVLDHKEHKAPDPNRIGSNRILETLIMNKKTGQLVTIFNCHLMVGAYNGDTSPKVRARRKTLWNNEYALLRKLAKAASKHSDVFVLGDFNRRAPLPSLCKGSWVGNSHRGIDAILVVNPGRIKAQGTRQLGVERFHPALWSDISFNKPKEASMFWNEKIPVPGDKTKKIFARTMLSATYKRVMGMQGKISKLEKDIEAIKKAVGAK